VSSPVAGSDAAATAAGSGPSSPFVVLGVAGGIAAYKAAELLRLLTESGHTVRVVPTAAALQFVGGATWAALSGQPVTTDVWADAHEVPHVRIGQRADLVVVAPATADLLARAAHGLADDLLTSTLLTARCPVLMAPAMHTEMWQHPATVENVVILRRRGVLVLEPASGRLTGTDTGPGRLPEPQEIFEVCRRLLRRGVGAPADLTGRRILVTAGGTREPLDPVRFLGNRSSGRQGYAFARTAVARGAQVTVVAANVALPDPAGVRVIRVGTTAQLHEATLAEAGVADVVVMAAAPADFRPAAYSSEKIRKGDHPVPVTLELTGNPDIAADLGRRKPSGQVLVVFAAETSRQGVDGAVLDRARAKLTAKQADLVVLNVVGVDRVFGQASNAVTVLTATGERVELDERPKEEIADAVWDLVVTQLSGPDPAG
jgi:phosphopantothenoylcysteine decarboxylase / phosphopantothenate---cysteine ligase